MLVVDVVVVAVVVLTVPSTVPCLPLLGLLMLSLWLVFAVVNVPTYIYRLPFGIPHEIPWPAAEGACVCPYRLPCGTYTTGDTMAAVLIVVVNTGK